jgi:hypothetical protein
MPAPQAQDGISMADKAIADSKKALASAVKFNGPVKKTPVSPVKPTPKPKMASTGLLGGEGTDIVGEMKAKGDNVDQYVKNVPKMHKGGEVMEDGVKNLQKGEVVIPKEKAEEGKKVMALKKKAKGPMAAAMEEEDNEPKSEAKSEEKGEKSEKSEGKKKAATKEDKAKPHNFHRTETIHHRNGSHTTTHHPHPAKPGADGKMPEQAEPVSYASPDMASLQQGMQENIGGGPQAAGPSAAAPAAEAAPAAV